MDAGRKHKSPWLETKDIITHGLASNIFALIPLSSKWNFQHDRYRLMLHIQSVCISAENTGLGESTSFIAGGKQAYSLFQERCSLNSQSCCVNNPE